MTVTLHAGDNRETLRRLIDQGVRVHSVVTDPPYGLTSVVKRFGKEGAAPAKHGTDGAFARASGGFMGKVWDGTGIERDPEFWRLIHDILLPGGFVFAFSGSRTGHWQACAMEMAGFIMHPMHGWLYGSGMPKAHNPCPGIDKAVGAEGGFESLGETVRRMRPGADQNADGSWEKLEDRTYERGRYVPTSPEAQAWDGWRYGTQTQKPALEPVYLGQKPFSEKTGVANLLKHGVGALNIDGCRVPTADDLNGGAYGKSDGDREQWGTATGMYEAGRKVDGEFVQPEGRWPANVLHDDSDAVRAIFPDSKGSGPARTLKRSAGNRNDADDYGFNANMSDEANLRDAGSGSAARFFNNFPLSPDDYQWAIDAGLIDDVSAMVPAIYHGKAKKTDRNGSKHPTVKAIALMEHFIRHITPPGGTVLDPFAGSGTTGEAARRLGFDCILMEAEPEYIDFLRQRFDMASPDDLDDLLGEDVPAAVAPMRRQIPDLFELA
jgi:site-specific DNA-methyltransferase (adenine-specific)